MKKILYTIPVLIVAFIIFALATSKKPAEQTSGTPETQQEGSPPLLQKSAGTQNLGASKSIRLGKIGAKAEIIYHAGGYIYTMDRNGGNVTQITFDKSRGFEHASVSRDRKMIIANEQIKDGEEYSILWLYDLEKGTETQVLPNFVTAGNGGVDWDDKGFMYFSAKEKNTVVNPTKPADFVANEAANDVYKIKFDGTGLVRLTNTSDSGDNDVSVSEDSTMVAYIKGVIDLAKGDYTENWVMNADGSNGRRVYTGGKLKIASVHDVELSTDNRQVVFSKVNTEVPPNFPNLASANTAHDIWVVNLDGTGLKRATAPGPISIIPDLLGNRLIYTEINERGSYNGISSQNIDGTDYKRIKPGGQFAKWIY